MKLLGNVSKAVSDGSKFQLVIESATADPDVIGELSIMARSTRTVDLVIEAPDYSGDDVHRSLIVRAAVDLSIGDETLLGLRGDTDSWLRMMSLLRGSQNWTTGEIDRLADAVDALLKARGDE